MSLLSSDGENISLEINAKDILSILPHRYPFLFIDRVIELEPGKRILARQCVSNNEPFVAGAFPDNPVMPGVIMLESIAQAGAILLLAGAKSPGEVPALMGIRRARFLQPVTPGDVLNIEVKIARLRGKTGWADAVARVGPTTVCTMAFSFSFIPVAGF